MKLRYSGNIMPFEDSMKKVSAITWAPSGKKVAVGAADRVPIFLCRLFTCLMTMETRRTSSPPNHQTKVKKATSSGVLNFLLTPRRSQLLRATISSSSIKWVYNGDRRKLSVTNSQSLLQSPA